MVASPRGDAAPPARPDPDEPRWAEGPDGSAEPSPEHVRRRNVRDVAMLLLGVASLAIVGYDFLYGHTLAPGDLRALEFVDLGIVLVFVAEFAWRWRDDRWGWRFVVRNWFDVLGMVPMMATNIPLFRAFRLLRVGMVASRILRMWAYATGHRSAQVVFDRYRAALVEQVTDRVMLRTLALAEEVAARGSYVKALGDSLGERREDIAEAAVKGAREGGMGRLVGAVPGAEAALRTAALATVDSVVVTLRSEEMQRTFAASVKAVLDQTREELGRQRWRERYAPERPGVLGLGARDPDPAPAGPGDAA